MSAQQNHRGRDQRSPSYTPLNLGELGRQLDEERQSRSRNPEDFADLLLRRRTSSADTDTSDEQDIRSSTRSTQLSSVEEVPAGPDARPLPLCLLCLIRPPTAVLLPCKLPFGVEISLIAMPRLPSQLVLSLRASPVATEQGLRSCRCSYTCSRRLGSHPIRKFETFPSAIQPGSPASHRQSPEVTPAFIWSLSATPARDSRRRTHRGRFARLASHRF